MSPETMTVLKYAGIVVGLVAAAPIVWASIKAAVFFGSMEKTVKTLEELCKGFSEVTRTHGEAIVEVRTDVRNIWKEMGRRETDKA